VGTQYAWIPTKGMRALVFVSILFLALTTLASFVRSERWWVRIWDFPRLQLAVLGLLLAVGHLRYVGLESGWLGVLTFVVLVACIGYQAQEIIRYTPLAKKQARGVDEGKPGSTIRLLMTNVLMSNRHADRLLQVIRDMDPDVIIAVETNGRWEEGLRDLERTHPYTVKEPRDNTYGMLVYSRFELVDPKLEHLVQDDIPSVHAGVLLPSGNLIELHGLHPRPPAPTEAEDSEPRDVELIVVGKAVRASALPGIVAGDLNDVAWSHTTRLFQRISGLLDPRVGRGLFNTFHSSLPFLRFPLDHIFHDPAFRVVRMKRLPRVGSDHFPVFAELSYEPASDQPEPIRPEPGDHEEAAEKEGALPSRAP
jgi:endonuclease/exonuclease/phosphatase (EEP) superfamily protein YafD